MTDTRKDKRAPVSLKVRFKSATVDEFIEQYARDISHGGLFIKSKQPMAIGTLLKFEFQLKDESKLIQGVGRVVWKREPTDAGGDDKPAGMGIKFIKMDPESKQLVDQIVDQRGAAPGQFEAGAPAGALTAPDPDDAPGDAAPAKPARPVRSQKATMQFFPSTTPAAEMPPPEDRTQVRHASEFLASALASGGADDLASKEADKKAEEARRRSEEIEAERERAAQEAREAKEAEESSAKERAERERAEAEAKAERAAAEAAKAAEPKKAEPEEAPAPKKKAESVRPAAKKAESERPAAKPAEKKPAVAMPAPTPARAESSNLVPIVAGLLVVAGVGGYLFFSSQTPPATTPATVDTRPEPPPPVVVADPPDPTVDPTADPTADPTVDPTADPTVDPTVDPTAVVGTEVVPPTPPAPTFEVRVETTPPGASILVGGVEMGTSPATLNLPEGAATLVARLPAYREGTSDITVADGMRPVRITLAALPYAVEVTTTPPGARVTIGTRSVTAPGRTDITRPTAAVRASATLTGYLPATTTIETAAFVETPEAMVATIAITLEPRPVAVVRPGGSSSGGRPGGSSGGAASGSSSGGAEAGSSSGGAAGGSSSGGAEAGSSSGGAAAGGSSGGAAAGGSSSGGSSSGGSSSGGSSSGGTEPASGSSGGSSSGGSSSGGSSSGGGTETETPPENPF